ncbi:cadmium transporter [Intestinibaculum porci]|uniref:Cd(2+)-exporting ATPase n=2 Tax=Intestinibaculum porci TaxID=2487118 RepID=A0A3G9JMT4_9FIRM|nr:heavy metal translocating P-type ATPase [Intestinibaculum porci]BBH26313.1 cadmium transporter [Intestinibaculum porci]
MLEMSDKLKKDLKMIGSGLIAYIIVVIIDHSGLLAHVPYRLLLTFLLYLIPYIIVGGEVVKKALIGIKNKQMFDESFLMAVATFGAFATGENAEAVAVMLFYQVGEWFQSYAVGKSRKNISDLMDIEPEYANIERDGKVEECDPYDVEVGDTLVIKPGERVPVDGEVIEGSSLVNTSALTGESVPRSVKQGDEIISGCVNGEGLLKIRATKMYEDSTVAKILDLVENASSKKSKVENFITRFARIYTPAVVFAALALALIPPLFVGHWMTWIYRACTFLVISCPCALVISVPLAFFGGIGAASKAGVLVKGSNYLESVAHLTTVVSDKTGTLTKGVFQVNDVKTKEDPQKVLYYAALAEHLSTHPIANSIKQAYQGSLDEQIIKNITNVAGQGVICETSIGTIYVGNKRLMEEQKIAYENSEDAVSTIVYVAKDAKFLGTILISDEIKPEAKAAIEEMKAAGVKDVVMLTGDKKSVGDAVGKQLGVDEVYSELLPGDKVEKVEALLKSTDEKHTLAFIGDGINDAPVLARADVGIAMGSLGSDAAIEAADVVIMDDNIKRIPAIIRIARKTIAISNQNIIFSLAVKFAVLILGAVGLANMWMAVFADVGVAVIAIINSMRALRTK